MSIPNRIEQKYDQESILGGKGLRFSLIDPIVADFYVFTLSLLSISSKTGSSGSVYYI